MGVHQFGRKLSFVVGTPGSDALDLSQLRVQFIIRRGDLQTPNTLDARIFNLTDDTANRIGNEFSRVVLQAGYEGGFGTIFEGSITQVRAGRIDQKDSYVDITAADGDEMYNFATISKSLEAQVAKSDNIVLGFIQSMAAAAAAGTGDPVPVVGQDTIDRFLCYKPQLDQNGSVRGRVFYGMTRDELREFARSKGLAWSIQDGKIALIPLTSFIPGPVPEISAATGMIGVPETTQNGLSVRVLLNPLIKIGQAVRIRGVVNRLRFQPGLENHVQTLFVNEAGAKVNKQGLYYVMAANHSGDTRGNAWYTDLTCLAIDAAIPFDMVAKAAIQPAAASVRVYP